jgi:photosystem II stability/assembly factor-like uncharacterized protein
MRRALLAGALIVISGVSVAVAAQPRVPAGPLWAVGHTENFVSERVLGALVERLHHGSWHRVSIPKLAGGAFNAVAAVGPDDAWAVGSVGRELEGHTLIEHWDGSSWSRVPSPTPGGFDALEGVSAASAGDVWAVGLTGRSPVGGPPLILHWDGTSWKQVPTSAHGALQAVDARSASDAWAVGYTAKFHTLILHWDGSAWTRVPSPTPKKGHSTQLLGVAAVAAKEAWAVGGTGNNTLIERWNGSNWKRVRSPSPGGLGDWLSSVAVLSARNAWAVGETSSRAGTNTLIEHWDGSSWRRVPSPTPLGGNLPNLFLNGVVALSSADVWAVGAYDTGRAWLTLAEHWNGSSWQQVKTANPRSANYLGGVG